MSTNDTQPPSAAAGGSPIPERFLELGRELGRLARKHRLMKFGAVFTPPWNDTEWRDEIAVRWEAGRHEEDAGKIFITSTLRVNTVLSENEQSSRTAP